MKKRTASIILAFTLLFSTSTIFSHPGRTDSSGGHKDNKNKSGLGSYHYHCGDYSAHLHQNGVCPYKNTEITTTKSATNASSKSTKQVPVDKSLQAQVPNFSVIIDGVDISTNSAEYPPLLFNDITYIPFTSDIIGYLDLEYIWDNPRDLIINRSADIARSNSFNLQFQNGVSTKGMNCNIIKMDKDIIINGIQVDSQYPIINYKDINYFPLTYEVVSNLGLSNKWDQSIGFELILE